MAKKSTPVAKKVTVPKKVKKARAADKDGNGVQPPSQKPERTRSPRDRFGSRIGSLYAKANAVLSKSPKKMSVIMKEAGLEKTCYVHMNKMVTEGKIGKSEEGYFLLDGE